MDEKVRDSVWFVAAIALWLFERGLDFADINSTPLLISCWVLALFCLEIGFWIQLRGSVRIGVMTACGIVGTSLIAWAAWPHTPSFPSSGEGIVGRYGLVGDGRSLFAVIHTQRLAEFANSHVLLVAALLPDYSLDTFEDTRLQRASTREITGRDERVEIRVDDDFKSRINSMKKIRISFYVCLIPRERGITQLSTLRQVELAGGHIIGSKGLSGPLGM
jgi:hypothetical protein